MLSRDFPDVVQHNDKNTLARRFSAVRQASETICAPLAIEDYVVQTMPEVSPPKWHLAHTSWFFEQFLLHRALPDYQVFDANYGYLFNSYYESVGRFFPRTARGTLSRPTVSDVYAYRHYVTNRMLDLIADSGALQWQAIAPAIELGIHHEQQHQELMLTDIKHILATNPLHPVYHRPLMSVPAGHRSKPLDFSAIAAGQYAIGHSGPDFAFDNEMPRHRVFVEASELANRPVTNGDYLAFMGDGGYRRPEFWLSDGWAAIKRCQWQAPLYWERDGAQWRVATLQGLNDVVLDEPVCHVSYFEADAYARWAGGRLPTEAEWEVAARAVPLEGNFRESGMLHPQPCPNRDGLQQLFGDVWEWMQSAYGAYPGYRPLPGALGEYNGKFMCNQFVLRGGSCVTAQDHMRVSYRNFFGPADRWQFSGIRLARDANSALSS